MSMLLLVLLGAAAGFAISEFFFDDDDTDTGTGPIGDEPEGEIVRVDTAPGFTGSDGNDAFSYDPQASGAVTTAIDAGAGDDVIDLATLFNGPALVGSSVLGGDGDDQIQVRGGDNTISGGDGDDTIFADSPTSFISGDAGDDAIRATNVSADISTVDGGEGNDTIDVTGSDNINVTGGEGDDLLISDGRTIVGTGYAINMDGGEGTDTLQHSVEVFPLPSQDPAEAAATLTGGAGADTFDISLTTGNGSFTAADDDPATFLNQAARITDFEQGTDVLSLDIPASLAGYTAESGSLSADGTANQTTFTISLVADGLPDQNIQIIVNGTGLTWDDVAFTGQTPPLLVTI